MRVFYIVCVRRLNSCLKRLNNYVIYSSNVMWPDAKLFYPRPCYCFTISSARIIQIQLLCLPAMTDIAFGSFFFFFPFLFFERHTRRSDPSRVHFLLPLTNKAWISQHAWHSLQPVFPGVLKRPLSFPPRITEHKDTQSCRVIQFVLSSLPHRLFA